MYVGCIKIKGGSMAQKFTAVLLDSLTAYLETQKPLSQRMEKRTYAFKNYGYVLEPYIFT